MPDVDPSAMTAGRKIVFATPSYRIQETDWRFIVYHEPNSVTSTVLKNGEIDLVTGPRNHTDYEWLDKWGRWRTIDDYTALNPIDSHRKLHDRLASVIADHIEDVQAAW